MREDLLIDLSEDSMVTVDQVHALEYLLPSKKTRGECELVGLPILCDVDQ